MDKDRHIICWSCVFQTLYLVISNITNLVISIITNLVISFPSLQIYLIVQKLEGQFVQMTFQPSEKPYRTVMTLQCPVMGSANTNCRLTWRGALTTARSWANRFFNEHLGWAKREAMIFEVQTPTLQAFLAWAWEATSQLEVKGLSVENRPKDENNRDCSNWANLVRSVCHRLPPQGQGKH